MSSTRLLVLPSLALAAVFTVVPGASAATPSTVASPALIGFNSPSEPDSSCGRAAVPATFETVHHPAVSRTLPAQTHSEWQWQRAVSTADVEVSRLVVAAARSYSWSRVVEHLEAEYSRTVIDQAYVPASPEQGHLVIEILHPAVIEPRWLYEQDESGNVRWENKPFRNPGQGWDFIDIEWFEVRPAEIREVWEVTRAAVSETPEVSHVETEWVSLDDGAPAGFTATGATRLVGSTVETAWLPEGVEPDGGGWARGAMSGTAAVTEERWIPEGDPVPDGFAPTGAIRDGGSTLETTSVTSPNAPEGHGWEVVPGSEVVVTDVEETVEVETAAWDEQVQVTPGVAATAPCAADPAEEPDGQPDLDGVIEGAPDDAAPGDAAPDDA
ncbi:hypothetical protein E7Z54_09970, partial [Nocardioides sp.]